jgi:post-segregation antitoxin (ccd killing protein)
VLSSTASGWLRSQHKYKKTAIRHKRKKQAKTRKLNQLLLFTFKRKFIEISVDLQTALAAEANEAEGQWLEESVLSKNTNVHCLEETGAPFGLIINMY